MVLNELKRFRQSLIEMFSSIGKSVIFMETCCETRKAGSHTFIECIPVDNEIMDTLPIAFKVLCFLFILFRVIL